ncbi:FAD:protein FMN transferase [Chloroflexota bacterium]
MKNSKNTSELLVGSLAIIASVIGLTGCTRYLTKYEAARDLMDTFATITVFDTDDESAADAMTAAFNRIEEIESKASVFDETAEAFCFNRDGCLDNPSDDLLKLVTMSAYYFSLTDGYFDITVQPLLELWGEGELWKESPEVQQARIDETIQLVGCDKMCIQNNEIYFDVDGMKITLGGITKGYAADEALRVLADKGIKHALVNLGGDMSALGCKPDGEPWQIALVNPDDTSQSLATFYFSDKSITTSGNYIRYFDPEKKAGHILNPRTGYSSNGCISATIIANDGSLADVLATAVFIMGPAAGLELVESLDDVECLIVDADRVIHRSSGLNDYLS